ncbi:MAG: hydrogenase nickel incorporation protein HypB [Bacteroidetes bacterium]|jgi:hydrogenase nickel incorporation protein HypB|nr:hydrogenase nickel incorporation protein HypB [Bacteroidota bacterium]
MCGTCGCQDNHNHNHLHIGKPSEAEHHHHHDEHHGHHDHSHGHGTEIQLEKDILSKNNLLAERNRGYLEARQVFAINLVSSPGAGKTTLLERTITDLSKQLHFAVIEGDQQTMNDAKRIEATGAEVVQVNTGSGCHLDAHMVNHSMKELSLPVNAVLLIENVGNLVCPALFDLGESKRAVVISVTEGDDKPQKYPYIFESSDICIINKTDLLPYVQFDVEKLKASAGQLNSALEFIELSATTGKGLELWYNWLADATGHRIEKSKAMNE